MKIVSWNVGSFLWTQYLPGRQHYSFQKDNLSEVVERLKNENADIIFLQEILEEDIQSVFDEFPEFEYKKQIHTGDRLSLSLFLSRYPITEIEHTGSHDYIINGLTFFPIHLYAFSPKKRLLQTMDIFADLPDQKGIILGDANFWMHKKFFLSRLDRISYKKILEKHTDELYDLSFTCRIFLCLDKIFTTFDVKVKNQKIVKHKIKHMDHYMISLDLDL